MTSRSPSGGKPSTCNPKSTGIPISSRASLKLSTRNHVHFSSPAILSPIGKSEPGTEEDEGAGEGATEPGHDAGAGEDLVSHNRPLAGDPSAEAQVAFRAASGRNGRVIAASVPGEVLGGPFRHRNQLLISMQTDGDHPHW